MADYSLSVILGGLQNIKPQYTESKNNNPQPQICMCPDFFKKNLKMVFNKN